MVIHVRCTPVVKLMWHTVPYDVSFCRVHFWYWKYPDFFSTEVIRIKYYTVVVQYGVSCSSETLHCSCETWCTHWSFETLFCSTVVKIWTSHCLFEYSKFVEATRTWYNPNFFVHWRILLYMLYTSWPGTYLSMLFTSSALYIFMHFYKFHSIEYN